MTEFLPYLPSALAVIVALWAFKRAKNLHHQADLLLLTIKTQKAYFDQAELHDQLGMLADGVERNRETLAKIQGRAGQKKWKSKDVPIDAASVKQELRRQLSASKLNGES